MYTGEGFEHPYSGSSTLGAFTGIHHLLNRGRAIPFRHTAPAHPAHPTAHPHRVPDLLTRSRKAMSVMSDRRRVTHGGGMRPSAMLGDIHIGDYNSWEYEVPDVDLNEFGLGSKLSKAFKKAKNVVKTAIYKTPFAVPQAQQKALVVSTQAIQTAAGAPVQSAAQIEQQRLNVSRREYNVGRSIGQAATIATGVALGAGAASAAGLFAPAAAAAAPVAAPTVAAVAAPAAAAGTGVAGIGAGAAGLIGAGASLFGGTPTAPPQDVGAGAPGPSLFPAGAPADDQGKDRGPAERPVEAGMGSNVIMKGVLVSAVVFAVLKLIGGKRKKGRKS